MADPGNILAWITVSAIALAVVLFVGSVMLRGAAWLLRIGIRVLTWHVHCRAAKRDAAVPVLAGQVWWWLDADVTGAYALRTWKIESVNKVRNLDGDVVTMVCFHEPPRHRSDAIRLETFNKVRTERPMALAEEAPNER